MRSPEQVLKALNKHGKVSDYKFERLYRILYNVEMFYMAYQRIYAKPGNMTPGSDGKTIDQMSTQRISRIIASLKDESYKPNPARRKYIPKKNGKKRPLGIPSFEDKLVQEVVRTILEAIYEEVFEDSSHGFRPNRSCHTALTRIQKTFKSTKWFIEGDIKGFGVDSILLGTLAYNVGPAKLLGSKTIPKSTLIKKLEAGDRNIYREYIAFCNYKGKRHAMLLKRRKAEFALLYIP